MTNTTTIMGILVLMIGVLGIFGCTYVYMQISEDLSTLETGESVARTLSSIPLIGDWVSDVTTPTADAIYSIRTSIRLFFFSNILLNIALIFSGAGLISIGRDMSYMDYEVTKIRKYLLKEKEEDKKNK